MCLLLLFHKFLSGRSANASECCSPVPYTVQWQFQSRLLFLHVKLVHVFHYSSCIVAVSPNKPRLFTEWSSFTCIIHQNMFFFCKHVNRENFPASLRKQRIKNKKGFTGTRTFNFGLKPSTLFSDSLSTTVILYLLRHRIACYSLLVNTNNCMS